MSIEFSREELELINDLAEYSYASSIRGKEITYGENFESLINNSEMRSQFSIDTLLDYIEQLELEKKFCWTAGIDDVPIIDKMILFLEEIIEEKKKQTPNK